MTVYLYVCVCFAMPFSVGIAGFLHVAGKHSDARSARNIEIRDSPEKRVPSPIQKKAPPSWPMAPNVKRARTNKHKTYTVQPSGSVSPHSTAAARTYTTHKDKPHETQTRVSLTRDHTRAQSRDGQQRGPTHTKATRALAIPIDWHC